MQIHILNGDALVERIQETDLEGKIIVCRECLIEGPVKASSLEHFWQQRASFIAEEFNDAEIEMYYEKVVSEFEKLQGIEANSEINLWFENDLFCQANLWFSIYYLHTLNLNKNLFRVFPIKKAGEDEWSGFGKHTVEDLKGSCQHRVSFSKNDVQLAVDLWKAYAENNFEELKKLSATSSKCFDRLAEVVQAHIDRFPREGKLGRPQKRLLEIRNSGRTGFYEIFEKFFKKEGIYGFGDVQVKNMLAEL